MENRFHLFTQHGFCSHSLVTFSKNVELTPRMQKKTADLLRYWGARMPQISHSYPRSFEQVDLSESVHARWVHTGGVKLSAGQCLIFDLVEAIQSQVIHITPMSSTRLFYLLLMWGLSAYCNQNRRVFCIYNRLGFSHPANLTIAPSRIKGASKGNQRQL